MTGPSSPTVGNPARFVRDLQAFLSLEAPFLLTDLNADLPVADLEAELLDRLAETCRSRPELAAVEIHPGLSQGDAVAVTVDALRIQLRGFFRRQAIRAGISDDERLLMYRTMLLARGIDDHLKAAFHSKEIRWQQFPSPQKGFRSTGQEAIVGASLRLRRAPEYGHGAEYRGDYICPLIRDLAALLLFMPDPTHMMLVQYGKKGTPVEGRDLHYGDPDYGVLPAAAPLAIGTQNLVGAAWALKQRGEDRVCVSFIGDGGTSLGEWHEAVNFAAAKRLNLIFIVENNQWALGTHVSEQTAAARFALKGAGYGIPGVTLFGNDPEEIAAGVGWAAERARSGEGPTLIELVTYRRAGHAHHDDDRFHGVPESGVPGYEYSAEREAWMRLDPVDRYEERLLERGVVTAPGVEEVRREVVAEVAAAAERAAAAPWPTPDDYRHRVYAPRRAPVPEAVDRGTRRLSYDEAIRLALQELMEEDEAVYVLGEDVGGRYGGAFGVTRGLAKRFGTDRCLNTPLAESAIVGCAVGSAILGMRPIVEMQFADFLAPAFNALVNGAAKNYWRWGRALPMVVRLPYGAATGTGERLLGGGPFHSQCPEMWFFRTPGWKIVAPSSPLDAKGLMVAAVRDENPVIFLEAKGLYGFHRPDLRQEVPVGTSHEIALGTAAVRRQGDDLTVITYGAMVWTAMAAAATLAEEGIAAEVVDLRSLWPLDMETVTRSVAKTNRVLVLHEDSRRGGLAGEISAILADEMFYHLDAPIRRVTAPDTPVPYAPSMEVDYLPSAADVVAAARAVVGE